MPMRVLDSKTVVVPAGKYWLGDPCYAFSNHYDKWNEVLNSSNGFLEPVAKVGEHELMFFGTAYGDGRYDSDLGDVPVDAGLVGLVPVEASMHEVPFGMHLVEFTTDTRCWDDQGKLNFGPHCVDTDPDHEDEEDEEDEEEEPEDDLDD